MIHYTDLTHDEIKQLSDGCGVTARKLRVPDFIFTADCDRHDFYYARGTGAAFGWWPWQLVWWYLCGQFWLQRANIIFYYLMLHDALSKRHELLEKMIYSFLATIYFIAVCAYAVIPNPRIMCAWKTKAQILKEHSERR